MFQWSRAVMVFALALLVSPSWVSAQQEPISLTKADFNGDMIEDLFIVSQNSPNVATIILKDSGGGEKEKVNIVQWPPTYDWTKGTVVFADITGDGCSDVVHVTPDDYAEIHISNCSGGLRTPYQFYFGKRANPAGVYATKVGTWSAVGCQFGKATHPVPKAVLRHHIAATNTTHYWIPIDFGPASGFMINGECQVSAPVPSPHQGDPLPYVSSSVPRGMLQADFDGDGQLDWFDIDKRTKQAFVILAANKDRKAQFISHQGKDWRVLGTVLTGDIKGKFNGLTCADIIHVKEADHSADIYLSNCDGTFQTVPSPVKFQDKQTRYDVALGTWSLSACQFDDRLHPDPKAVLRHQVTTFSPIRTEFWIPVDNNPKAGFEHNGQCKAK